MPKYIDIASLLLTLDVAGTAVFAVSGAAVGVKHRLDAFGVCVLALVAGNAGGMLRDILIGAIPPAAFVGWKHVTISLLAGVVTSIWHPRLERLQTPILMFDAAGLGRLREHQPLSHRGGPRPTGDQHHSELTDGRRRKFDAAWPHWPLQRRQDE